MPASAARRPTCRGVIAAGGSGLVAGRRLRGLRVLRVLLLRGLALGLGGAIGRRLLHLARPALRAVIRVVEALALEVHGHRVEDALDLRLALGTLLHGVVGHPLHDLEDVTLVALV